MGRYNVVSKTDRAIVAYIIENGAGTVLDTFPAKKAADIEFLPYTSVFTTPGRVKVHGTGEYTVQVKIQIFTNAAPDKGELPEELEVATEDRASTTWDLFHLEADAGQSSCSNLADAITAAARASGDPELSDFTVLDVTLSDMEQGYGNGQAEWMDSLMLEMVVAPYDVTS